MFLLTTPLCIAGSRRSEVSGIGAEHWAEHCQCGLAERSVRQQSWQEIVNESLILIRNGESIRPRVMRYTS